MTTLCVFDAYGTLFDFNSASSAKRSELGDDWQRVSELWRQKQLQYTWLRGLAGHHADFWTVTGDALDFALAATGRSSPELRESLMNSYLGLSSFPEVPATLRSLQASGRKLAILSNGTPAMLEAAINAANLQNLFDAVLSVEEVGIFKPHPSVYRLAPERLNIAPSRICFVSSNAWDAFSAKAFGLKAVWCNRLGQQPERIPATPDAEISDLAGLPGLLV